MPLIFFSERIDLYDGDSRTYKADIQFQSGGMIINEEGEKLESDA